MSLTQKWSFLRQYFVAPAVTGAVAPSSARLAEVLTTPFSQRTKAARVLEVGAGTGAVTRAIGRLIGPDDHVDICELQPQLADILERDVLGREPLASAVREGRVRLIRGPVEEIDAPDTYDFIIAGLPFTAFKIADVRRIMGVIERNLKADGVFSYFEYIGLRRIARNLRLGDNRRNILEVSNHLDELIARHQVSRQAVWGNIPPAYGRHWTFRTKSTGQAGSIITA